jgi:hypothetical protein
MTEKIKPARVRIGACTDIRPQRYASRDPFRTADPTPAAARHLVLRRGAGDLRRPDRAGDALLWVDAVNMLKTVEQNHNREMVLREVIEVAVELGIPVLTAALDIIISMGTKLNEANAKLEKL